MDLVRSHQVLNSIICLRIPSLNSSRFRSSFDVYTSKSIRIARERSSYRTVIIRHGIKRVNRSISPGIPRCTSSNFELITLIVLLIIIDTTNRRECRFLTANSDDCQETSGDFLERNRRWYTKEKDESSETVPLPLIALSRHHCTLSLMITHYSVTRLG